MDGTNFGLILRNVEGFCENVRERDDWTAGSISMKHEGILAILLVRERIGQ